MFLDVVRGRSATGGAWLSAHAADMHADGKVVGDGRLVDGPVAPAAGWFIGPRRQQHLDEAAIAGTALDLSDGGLRILGRDHDRAAQPRLLGEPLGGLPVVHGPCKRGAVVHIALAACTGAQGHENAVLHPIGIEVLLAHKVEVRAGRAAVRRPGVAARHVGRHARISERLGQCLANVPAVSFEMMLPARREIRLEIGSRAQVGMNIAVDDGEARGLLDLRFANRNIHGREPSRLSLVSCRHSSATTATPQSATVLRRQALFLRSWRVGAHRLLINVRAPARAHGHDDLAVFDLRHMRDEVIAPRHLVDVVLHDPIVRN